MKPDIKQRWLEALRNDEGATFLEIANYLEKKVLPRLTDANS